MADRHWSGTVYYYLAALVGLVLVVIGFVGVFRGLVQAALPRAVPYFEDRALQPRYVEPVPTDKTPETPSPAERAALEREAESDVRREGLYNALQSLPYVVVGAPVFLWHIRRARERERKAPDV